MLPSPLARFVRQIYRVIKSTVEKVDDQIAARQRMTKEVARLFSTKEIRAIMKGEVGNVDFSRWSQQGQRAFKQVLAERGHTK